MENYIVDKIKGNNISPNEIKIPLSDNEKGIPVEFIQTNDQNCLQIFTCEICHFLAWDPVSCPKCDKIFCRSCRNKYGQKCLFKCDSLTIREITRNEKDYLNKIKIKCTNSDCSQYFKYYDYKNHLEKCKYRKYHCNNDGCKAKGYINEMMDHSRKCKYRKIICEKCNQKVTINKMDIHLKDECPEKQVICGLCGLKMKRGIYLKEHMSKNNDNPNCLKRQLEISQEKLNTKKNEINELKNKMKELEKKNEKYENENNNLKKKLEEIKQYITNGYNTYILEENKDNNKEKNILGILNINNEISKNNKELNYKKIPIDKKNENLEQYYLNTDNNFYPRNRNYYDINNYNINHNPENLFKSTLNRKKSSKYYNTDVKQQNISEQIKRVPSGIFSINKNNL